MVHLKNSHVILHQSKNEKLHHDRIVFEPSVTKLNRTKNINVPSDRWESTRGLSLEKPRQAAWHDLVRVSIARETHDGTQHVRNFSLSDCDLARCLLLSFSLSFSPSLLDQILFITPYLSSNCVGHCTKGFAKSWFPETLSKSRVLRWIYDRKYKR